jgi:site-specific recombinase XerD
MLLKLSYKYASERQARGEISPRTAKNQRAVLARFAEAVEHRAPKNIQRRHVEKWLESLDVRPGTRYRDWSVVRCFVRWCVLNGHMKKDPTIGVQKPTVPKAAPRKLTSVDARKVAAHAPDARARVMVLAMLQEALRTAEVVAIQMGDLDLDTQALAVRGKGGGGQVTRHVSLTDETAKAIRAYLAEYPAGAGPLIRSYLRPNRGISAHYLTTKMSEWMTEAGVKGQAWDGKTGHACRHTALSNMVEHGADVLAVSRIAGHSSLNTTLIYINGVSPDMRAAMGGRSYLDPGDQP